MTIDRLVPRDGSIDVGRALEEIARETLQVLDDEDLSVRFLAWEDGESVQYVCKVETPPGDPSNGEPPWRWWSSLFRTPQELRAELEAMVARRLRSRDTGFGAGDAPSAAAS